MLSCDGRSSLRHSRFGVDRRVIQSRLRDIPSALKLPSTPLDQDFHYTGHSWTGTPLRWPSQ